MIVFINLSFFGRGAVPRRPREEVRALIDAGYQVTVITDLKYLKYYYEFETYKDKLKIVSIKLIYIHRPFRQLSSELSFAIQGFQALKNIVKKEKVELIVCHSASACYAVARIANKYKIPSLYVIRSLIWDRINNNANPYNKVTTFFYKHAEHYALKNMPYSIAISNYMRKMAIAEGAKPETAIVKHNFVDTEKFYPDKNKIKDIDCLFIGRLSVEKGVSVLLKSLKMLSQKKKVVLIGDGILSKSLKSQAKDIQHDILFTGWIEHEELIQYIQRSKIVVVPSLSEPLGVVVIEAMACGVPVIGSNTGGIPDMIKHGYNGWLVKPNNPKSLANLIDRVLSQEDDLKEIIQAAIETANQFSKKSFNIDIVKFFEKFIRKSNS